MNGDRFKPSSELGILQNGYGGIHRFLTEAERIKLDKHARQCGHETLSAMAAEIVSDFLRKN